jgi:spermidine synthase
MKKILSYVWPVSKKINSAINGTLEITWFNGKKLLDSENANYSYGPLEKVLTYGLSKIDILPNTNILLLGLGGGSIIEPLRKQFNCTRKITAVEIDPIVIEIAKTEFNVLNSDDLEIVCTNALSFIKKSNDKFGLIIVDVFIDTKVPADFYLFDFWNALAKILKPKGSILFNAGINLKNDSNIQLIKQYFNNDFIITVHKNKVNTLLAIKRIK